MQREKLNCPNCGAVIENYKCPYCGSIFYDFAQFEIGQESYIRLKLNGQLLIFKAFLQNFEIHRERADVSYSIDKPVALLSYRTTNLNLDFILSADDRGVLLERYMEGRENNA